MDRNEAKRLATMIAAAVSAALKSEGYEAEVQGGTFDQAAGTYKPKLVVKKAGTDLRKVEFERYAHLFGLLPSDYGLEFKAGRETLKLIGVLPSSPKYGILCQRSDGKTMKYTDAVIPAIHAARKVAA